MTSSNSEPERYRLLKDVPGYPRGTVFERDTELRDGWQMVREYSGVEKNGDKYSGVYVETVGGYGEVLESRYTDPEWFEAVEALPPAKGVE